MPVKILVWSRCRPNKSEIENETGAGTCTMYMCLLLVELNWLIGIDSRVLDDSERGLE